MVKITNTFMAGIASVFVMLIHSGQSWAQTNVLYIDSAGHVGIGTGSSALQHSLELGGNMYMRRNTIYFSPGSNDTTALIGVGRSNVRALGIYAADGVILGNIPDGKIKGALWTDGQTDVHIPNTLKVKTVSATGIADFRQGFTSSGRCDFGKTVSLYDTLYTAHVRMNGHTLFLCDNRYAHTFLKVGDNAKAFLAGENGVALGFCQGTNEQVVMSVDRNNGNTALNAIMRVTAKLQVGNGGVPVERAQLVVNGRGDNYSARHCYYNQDNSQGKESFARQFSIFTDWAIAAGTEFFAYSDARIKKDFRASDNFADLATLTRIRITDYKYIDTIGNGNTMKKGVVAQQVQEVFPQAVATGDEFITDIYAPPASVKGYGAGYVAIAMGKPHGLCTGDVVKIIMSDRQKTDTVTVIDAVTFAVAGSKEQYEDIFVYGKLVHDMRMVDFDRLAILNISATQELVKEINLLKAQNEALRAGNEQMQSNYAQLENRLKMIEARLDAVAPPSTAGN